MASDTGKVEPCDITIEKLDDKHDLGSFQSYEKELLEGDLKVFFREKDIHYKSLPALKIGRLCVHDNFQRRGLGKLMVLFAITQANEICDRRSGCRFITLDAKRNEKRELDSIHFYKKLGFKILKERRKGTTPMYLDLKMPQQ